jgi:hypothetical protein
VVALLVAVGLANVVPVLAQESKVTQGPSLGLDRMSVHSGEKVIVTFTGWAGRLVTLSVCGNLAKRGSADCNMQASQGVRLYHVDNTPITSFVVSAPPVSCPCVIRATSDAGEDAYAPIEITDIATGPVVDPFSGDPPLDVKLEETNLPAGFFGAIRSGLGGPTDHQVEVTVRNASTESFSHVTLHGFVGRDANTPLDEFDLDVGEIGQGETWTGTAVVTVPAPAIGEYEWRVTASGAGPVSTAGASTRSVPWLLVLLVLILVGDLVAVVVRAVQRRRARTEAIALTGPVDADVVIDVRDHAERPSAPSSSFGPDDPTTTHEQVGATRS